MENIIINQLISLLLYHDDQDVGVDWNEQVEATYTPGRQDYLPGECYNKRRIEQIIRKTFYTGVTMKLNPLSSEYDVAWRQGIYRAGEYV